MKRYLVQYETGKGHLEVVSVRARSFHEAERIVRDRFDDLVDIVDVLELDE